MSSTLSTFAKVSVSPTHFYCNAAMIRIQLLRLLICQSLRSIDHVGGCGSREHCTVGVLCAGQRLVRQGAALRLSCIRAPCNASCFPASATALSVQGKTCARVSLLSRKVSLTCSAHICPDLSILLLLTGFPLIALFRRYPPAFHRRLTRTLESCVAPCFLA